MQFKMNLRGKLAGCLTLVLMGFSGVATAAFIEFNPNNGQQVYDGNVTANIENAMGLQFSVNQDNANSLVLDSIGVFVGEQIPSSQTSRIGFNLSTRDGSSLTNVAFGYQDVPTGPADWVDFDLGGLSLPRSYDNSSSRSTYVLQFFDTSIRRLNGRLYRSENGLSNPAFWDQGPLEFIYGVQAGGLSTLAPAVRFDIAPAAIPGPSSLVLLLLGSAVLGRRRYN